MRSSTAKTKGMVFGALLLALMLVLGYIEHLLPSVGVPGIKLGLSNSVLIFALYMLSVPAAYILMTLKVVLSGLLFSGVQAMAYAFSGGLISLTGMWLLSSFPRVRPVFVSVLGGVLHNLGQAAMAALILHAYMPVYWLAILGAGLACGALTGIAAQKTMFTLKRNVFLSKEEKKRPSVLMILIAVLMLLVTACLVWYVMWGSGPMTAVPVESPGLPKMLSPEELPIHR